MDIAESILIIVNLVLGFGCAIPFAMLLKKVNKKPMRFFSYFAILIVIYFIECVALVMGMGIPVFCIGLAFIWGIIFGFWLRNRTARNEILKASFFLSLYSSLPALSFILIPVIGWIGGRNIISAEAGVRFGIPKFVPFPLNTILGFYLAITIGAFVFKTLVTMGEVSWLIRRNRKELI